MSGLELTAVTCVELKFDRHCSPAAYEVDYTEEIRRTSAGVWMFSAMLSKNADAMQTVEQKLGIFVEGVI